MLTNLGNAELHGVMATFYHDVDRAIAQYNPVCRNRGECCRFESFGHRLYVTSIELIYFAQGRRNDWRRVDETGVCPYHVEGKCLARPHRPLGCRVFYCDPDTRDWSQTEYERRHGELQTLGARFGVDYRYVEWLSALREMEGAIFPAIGVHAGRIDSGRQGMIE